MTFVWAAIVALVFRFPIPFGGYASGFEGALMAPVAVAFYGLPFAGFLVPAAIALGMEAGMSRLGIGSGPRSRMWAAANIGALASVLSLATLDYVIGPW